VLGTDRAVRYRAIRGRVAAAARAAGRDPNEVGLIAVSKTFTAEAVAEVADAGARHFGESYAQELRVKAPLRPELTWHFIGRIQRNKAKFIAPVAARVHALESVAHARALLKHCPGELDALVAVNLAAEERKGGVLPEQALALCEQLDALPGLSLRGLMCIPPAAEDPEDAAPWFAQLADLASRGRASGLPLHELSMGMSSDFEVAIRHGATWVRVGSAIFGARS
jgi:PLP dependent protein